MTRSFGIAPTGADMEEMARAAFARLPEAFTQHLGDVVILVEDFADEATLRAMGIEEPYELTGLYEGLPMTERSIEHSGTLPDKVRLFRLPILLEWMERGDETLEHLVAHVLIHEIGHHFGFSDEEMHALEDMV
ncbi:metallopeptidase family protein [Sphingomicrobium arenosum]|uniref:metallopeptidase family protein n=1 Tax=Sphingomicrobium arenosum TaxID=2233861 RepID=UPI0022410203|nr:metallopeptidase family protein [Sphingomicrobium arenosum]